MLKKCLLSIILSASILLSGCAWWDNFKKDPINGINGAVNAVQSIISIASVVFGQVKRNLPVDIQDRAQAEFDDAVLTANTSIGALDHGLNAAAEAQKDDPDFGEILLESQKAAHKIQAVVDKYRKLQTPKSGAAPGMPPPDPAGMEELNRSIDSFEERYGSPHQ